jgi:hypothetical protein
MGHQGAAASGVRDGGRPPAIGLQEQIANHRKRRGSKARVVSVTEKAPRGVRWETGRRTPVNCRSSVESAQTTSKPVSDVAPGSVWPIPAYGPRGVRQRGSAILFQALTLNRGNRRRRCEAKGTSRQGEADSSDEAAVTVVERRGGVIQQAWGINRANREESSMTCKPYDIPKTLVWEAWLHVKANQGAAGIDAETIEQFEEKLGDNLNRIWNRMSSGSYFPPPVKAVPVPKKSGGVRIVEHDPWLLTVLAQSLHQQAVIEIVEQAPDVELDDPVVVPAAAHGNGDCRQCRLPPADSHRDHCGRSDQVVAQATSSPPSARFTWPTDQPCSCRSSVAGATP